MIMQNSQLNIYTNLSVNVPTIFPHLPQPVYFRFNFLPQIAAMPVSGTPAPTNKRKEPLKIITDFSNISQHGQWRLFVSHIHICSENTCTMGIILDERSLVISCDVQMSVVNVTRNYQSPH